MRCGRRTVRAAVSVTIPSLCGNPIARATSGGAALLVCRPGAPPRPTSRPGPDHVDAGHCPANVQIECTMCRTAGRLSAHDCAIRPDSVEPPVLLSRPVRPLRASEYTGHAACARASRASASHCSKRPCRMMASESVRRLSLGRRTRSQDPRSRRNANRRHENAVTNRSELHRRGCSCPGQTRLGATTTGRGAPKRAWQLNDRAKIVQIDRFDKALSGTGGPLALSPRTFAERRGRSHPTQVATMAATRRGILGGPLPSQRALGRIQGLVRSFALPRRRKARAARDACGRSRTRRQGLDARPAVVTRHTRL